MSLTKQQQAQFDRDGYITVSGLLEQSQIEAAREEIEKITYGKSFAEYLADHEQGVKQPAGFEPAASSSPLEIRYWTR